MNLLSLLKNIYSPQENELSELKALQELSCEYPYFQIAYMILTIKGENLGIASKAIQKHSIYITDLDYFKSFLNGDRPSICDPNNDQSLNEAQQRTNLESTRRFSTSKPTQTKHFINEYIDSISQKPPVIRPDRKSNLQAYAIDNFMSMATHPALPAAEEFSTILFDEDLQVGDKMIFGDHIATENLAKILLDQNKLQGALMVYERIMINCPERRADLQPIIDALKGKI